MVTNLQKIETLQDILDYVMINMISQGWYSSGDNPKEPGSTCLYRGEDECKCSVGFLISDELYKPEIEGLDASEEIVIDLVQNSLSSYKDKLSAEFLLHIQSIHDVTFDKEYDEYLPMILREAEKICKVYNLTYKGGAWKFFATSPRIKRPEDEDMCGGVFGFIAP